MHSQEISQRLLSHAEVKQFPFLLYPRARECSPTVESILRLSGLNVIGLINSINFYGLPRVWHFENSVALEIPWDLSIKIYMYKYKYKLNLLKGIRTSVKWAR